MKKWQKISLSFLTIIYLIGLSVMLWPQLVTKTLAMLRRINLNASFNSHQFIEYYGLTLLGITVLILITLLLMPGQKKDVTLIESKSGRLALGNEGITHFIQTQLSGEGLNNIRVKIKNTRHTKKFYIIADAVYRNHVITDLPRLKTELVSKLENLLAGTDNAPISVDIKVNQASNGKNKSNRVI